MLIYVWIALALGAVTLLGGLAFAGIHGLRGWRAFQAVSRSVGDGLAGLAASAAATAERATGAVERSGEIAAASARLQRSLAELAALRHAADEVRATAGRVTGLVPHK